MLAGVARRLTGKALDAKTVSVSQLLRAMLIGLVGNIIKIFGVLVALSQLGISVGPMLAGLGIAGFILGFALTGYAIELRIRNHDFVLSAFRCR